MSLSPPGSRLQLSTTHQPFSANHSGAQPCAFLASIFCRDAEVLWEKFWRVPAQSSPSHSLPCSSLHLSSPEHHCVPPSQDAVCVGSISLCHSWVSASDRKPGCGAHLVCSPSLENYSSPLRPSVRNSCLMYTLSSFIVACGGGVNLPLGTSS